jgi:DMSO/TMAO reductase YedYZ molybdopterin-dependent catalytic subunit
MTTIILLLSTLLSASESTTTAINLSGLNSATKTVTLDSVKKMASVEIPVVDPHSQKKNVYRGTSIVNVLKLAHAPLGERLKRQALRVYVEVEAEDGYKVIFSLAECDPETGNSDVYLAWEMDGKPLGDGVGPLKTVVPSEKAGKRWVRMVRKISLKTAP